MGGSPALAPLTAMSKVRVWHLGVAVCYAALTLGYMVVNSYTNPLGNFDFHLFWYNGHFLWEGRDPYAAYARGDTPTPPIVYLDGVTVNGDPARPKLHTIPTNTAPMLLVLMPLAKLSWLSAKLTWLFINTGLLLLAPWLTLRVAAQHGLTLDRWRQLAVAIAFYAIAAPQYAVGYGQSSLLVYNAMLLAWLLLPRHPLQAGLWLGLALSKYSLPFPLLILLVWARQWRVLAVAGAVQMAGVLWISSLEGTPPLQVVAYYVQYALEHADTAGIQLAALYNRSEVVRWLAPLLLTVGVGAVLWRWGLPRATTLTSGGATANEGQQHFSLLAIGLLWGTVAVYHRLYDGLLILPFLLLVAWAAIHSTMRLRRWLDGFGIAIVSIMALPVPLYEWIFSQYWAKIINSVWTVIFLASLGVALLLYRHLREGGRATNRVAV